MIVKGTMIFSLFDVLIFIFLYFYDFTILQFYDFVTYDVFQGHYVAYVAAMKDESHSSETTSWLR